MRKLLLSTFALAVAFAASAFNLAPIKSNAQLGAPINAKQAPKELVAKLAQKTVAQRAPKRINAPVTKASDLLGNYTWSFEMANSRAVDPSTVTGTAYTQDVVFYDANDEAGTFKIAGMFDAAITATLDLESYDYPTFTISDEELVTYNAITVSGKSVNLNCAICGIFYYEGDATNKAGWYFTDNLAFIVDDEIYWASNVWIVRVIANIITDPDTYGQYVGYSLNPLWKPSSEMVESQSAYNGLTTYNFGEIDMVSPAVITENENYVVTVNNFAGLAENPVNFTLEEGRTWTADHPVLFSDADGDFVFYGLDADANSLLDVTGTGTDNVLTFDCTWTGYDTETNYWLGQRNPATITLLDGTFIYPGEGVEPELYLAGSMTDWASGKEAMTLGEDGKFTITKEMEANAEFKFINENEEWIGGDANGNFIVTEDQVVEGTELTLLLNAGNNFQIPVAGTWTLTVDPENMKLVISGEWYEPAPEPVDVYILGEVNGNNWAPNVGLQMTKAEDANIYTADVAIDGRNDGYNYFSFTTKLAENADDWAGIAASRYGAQVNDFEVTEELLGTDLTVQAGENAFKIAKGDYSLSLNLDELKLVVTKKAAELKVGDVTGDGKVDIADVNAAINIILELKTQEDYPGNADLNNDGKVDISDVNMIINIILEN